MNTKGLEIAMDVGERIQPSWMEKHELLYLDDMQLSIGNV